MHDIYIYIYIFKHTDFSSNTKLILLTAGFRTGRKKNAIGGRGLAEREGEGSLPTIAAVWVQLPLCITEHHTTKIYEEAQ
jgi:hypothetical protein